MLAWASEDETMYGFASAVSTAMLSGIAVAIGIMIVMTASALFYRSAMGGKKVGLVVVFEWLFPYNVPSNPIFLNLNGRQLDLQTTWPAAKRLTITFFLAALQFAR